MAVKKIQSIQRGLAVLECINRNGEQSCTAIGQATNLSRGTAYRLLLTLEDQGYVRRDDTSGKYALTHRVMGLSHGFDLENWPTEVAKPIMKELCDKVIWPIGLTTLCGRSAIVRENTDEQSTLVFKYTKGGYAMPLLTSAAGWVLFAYSGKQVRDAIYDAFGRHPEEFDDSLISSAEELEERARSIREQGYTYFIPSRMRTTALSVPILRENGSILAALSLRFFTSAITHNDAVQQFVPQLNEAANEIAAIYSEWMRANTTFEKAN